MPFSLIGDLFRALLSTFPHAAATTFFMLLISGLNVGYNHQTFAESKELNEVVKQIKIMRVQDTVNYLESEIASIKRELYSIARIAPENLTRRDEKRVDSMKIELSKKEDDLKRLKNRLGVYEN